jgi:hypothetical protein
MGAEERWALLLVLIEHQSDTDRLMPLRLLLFAVLYWDRQWREWKAQREPRPTLELRPVLPVVLYTGPMPWGSTRTLVELLGEPREFHAFAPRWEPLIWNLAERTPEALLASTSEWLKALAVMRAEEAEPTVFRQVFAQAVRDLTALAAQDPVRWSDLMRMLLAWAFWRRPDAERDALVAEAVASQTDVERQQEIKTMTSKWGPTLAEVSMAKGKLVAARTILRALLEDRFGTVPEALAQCIEATDDLERLQTAARQMYRVQSVGEITL